MPPERIHLGTALLNFLFPPLCFCCGAPLAVQAELLCAACHAGVHVLSPVDPLIDLARSRLCGDGLCADLVSIFRFENGGPVQSLVHALKYGSGTFVGRSLGKKVGERVQAQRWSSTLDAIVPLPLHWAKERERGYNQAELLARGMATTLGLPVLRRSVVRTRWTRSQTALGFAERQANVESAFVVPAKARGALHGRNVLLVDDVITTGSTLRACASAVAACAPTGVYVASIALAEQIP